jgi:hypothetical protein
MSKAQRSDEAVVAYPQMSDRAIGVKIGVSQPTVSKARKRSTDNQLSVDDGPRIGLDCKQRRMPARAGFPSKIRSVWRLMKPNGTLC